MRITIPTAKKLKTTKTKQQTQTAKLEKVVARFLNETIKADLIQAAEQGNTSINTEVPTEAYADSKTFYRLCQEALQPLGYKAEESHDGGGMYSTLAVSWK
jgi:cobalamin biosynthesis protein CobT